MHKLKWSQFFLLTLCGGLTTFAFAPYFYWWVMALGVAELFFFIKKTDSPKYAFKCGFFFGMGMGACSMNWLQNALMVDGGEFQYYIPLIWIFFGLWFGLFWGLACMGTTFFGKESTRCLAFGGLFIICEWIRGFLFSGFPWNVVGNIWNDALPILQTTSVIGIYGLGGLTVMVFTSIALGYKSRFLWVMVVLSALLYGLGYSRLYFAENTNVWGTHLRLVQPNIPQTLKWNEAADFQNLNKLIQLSKKNNEGITHVLWPETAVSFLINYHETDRLHLMAALNQGSILITGGMRAVDPSNRTLANSIFVLDDLMNIRGFYDKAHLVPFGEYMPFRQYIPLEKVIPISSDIIAGDGVKTLNIPNTVPAGMNLCYESIFSGQVIDKNNRPQWIINATNDGWYGISAGPHQHFAMAQTRAIEEGLPFVRVANTGISAIIDPYGRIVKKLDLGEAGVVDGDLPQALPPTPFAQFGQKIPLILAGILLLFALKNKNSS